MKLIRVLFAKLREWSGDDAYERYLKRHRGCAHDVQSRRAFYRAYYDRRGRGGRCC